MMRRGFLTFVAAALLVPVVVLDLLGLGLGMVFVLAERTAAAQAGVAAGAPRETS